MIINDKKKLSTIILSRMKDGKASDMEVKPEESLSSENDDIRMIATDLMQALNDKSIEGLTEALCSLKALISEEDDEQDSEE